ncbi:MAG: SulP family inorganic anion transporter [Deltaproteobacteria bacterium]|nr:SulP family inorganic anion transporter [Deltaproteobacteria bacterium]
MRNTDPSNSAPTLPGVHGAARDYLAGLVVFFVALPLCLGIALASNAPLAAGLVSGVIGGIVVGFLSGSHTSVSGPAAGLAAVVAAQIATLGSFENLLAATVIAGLLQIVIGLSRGGLIALFFPSSVIKGLLAAIGVLLILKQIPHVLGHDPDPEGEMSFVQPDGRNTLGELFETLYDLHFGAATVGLVCLGLLLLWNRTKWLKQLPVPASLVVISLGVGLNAVFQFFGETWVISESHLVQVPVATSASGLLELISFPNMAAFADPRVYLAGMTIAVVASLETLLNLHAVDKIDPQQRFSPPNRELVAQGTGNILAGLFGGLPITSVIVRGSVNISAGGQTRRSAITHGVLLLGAVALFPAVINRIPLASLAAILLATGFKLANPSLFRSMWKEGRRQFLPFVITVVAIVATDLLIGILVGLAVSIAYILKSSFNHPLIRVMEKHASQDVLRIELSSQVGFFSRARLEKELGSIPRGGHVLIDARRTDFIDPDVLDLIDDFREKAAPARRIGVSFLGFKDHYKELEDRIEFVDHTTREVRELLTPAAVLAIFSEGNRRFRTGHRLTRDLIRQMTATSQGQAPLAAVLSCMDSRAPVELLFDLGLGDIFSIRVAGNIARNKIMGSLEYGCGVAGAKLILVLGHTSCGAITAAVDLRESGRSALEATGCDHLDPVVEDIQRAMPAGGQIPAKGDAGRADYVNQIARRNVLRVMDSVQTESKKIAALLAEGNIAIVGGIYHIDSGRVEFFDSSGAELGS